MTEGIKPVKKGNKVDLISIDANAKVDISRNEAEQEYEKMLDRLDKLQEVLYAECKHKILIVLQGKDTSGKDSTVRSV